MTPNNNLSVLPFYGTIDEQNARKWWVYGHVYPLYTPAGFILPFQFIVPHVDSPSIGWFNLFDAETGTLIENAATKLINTGLTIKQFPALGYDVVVYPGMSAAFSSMEIGRYYFAAVVNMVTYYSDVFTVVDDITPYLKLEWWDDEDFIMDAGSVVYTEPSFKNVVYLASDIAKPEYLFEEEGETRDGYFFPIKQISEKRYRFAFLAPEYLLDVMRLVRMADHVQITKSGKVYQPDTFLLTPSWESEGDVAGVEVEFETDTIAKKIGRAVL